MLFPAVGVQGYEPVGGTYDGFCAAVIFFDEQHLCVGIDAVEFKQPLRIRGAEAVNALVLVADHEKIAAPLSRPADYHVLYLRRVLRLIDTDVTEPSGILPDRIGKAADYVVAVKKLVIVVHQPVLALEFTVCPVYLRKIPAVNADLLYFPVVKHHVPAVSHGGHDVLYLVLGRVAAVLPEDVADNPRLPAVAVDERKRLFPAHPAVCRDDLRAEAVYRPYLNIARAENRLIPLLHLSRAGNAVGDRQHRVRRNVFTPDKIPQPRRHNGGFPASGDGKEQNMPLRLPARRILRGVKPYSVFGFVLFVDKCCPTAAGRSAVRTVCLPAGARRLILTVKQKGCRKRHPRE